MLTRAQFMSVTPRGVAARPAFTMRRLERLALWGCAAAAAMFIAAIAGRSDVGAQRVAGLFPAHSASSRAAHSNQAGAGPLDTEAATRELVQTVRGLTEDRDRLMTRLAAVERSLDDVTGSVTRQIEAAKTPPWPSEAGAPATPAAIASVLSPVVPPPAGLASPSPALPSEEAADATPAAAPPAVYGIDLGSAHSVEVLHARWTAFRSTRPKLFEGLRPLVSRKDIGRSKRTEWRLLVGPLPDAEAASRLCASLAAFWPFCQPTTFAGERLAER
jgi:hypothetical protein